MTVKEATAGQLNLFLIPYDIRALSALFGFHPAGHEGYEGPLGMS